MDHLKYDKDRESPLCINLQIHTTGEIIPCPCTNERFMCKTFFTEEGESPFAGVEYHYYKGWPILEKLTEIILFFKPYCVVEIGAGDSSLVLGKVTEKAGVELHTVDTKPQKECKYHRYHYYYNMTSFEFMKTFNDNPAVVLIDADHRYETAKAEFDFFFDKLVPGGVIFLHDTMPPHEEFTRDAACSNVYKLRQELEKRSKYLDCFTWPYSAGFMGLTMVIKKEKNRRFFEK